MRIEATRVDKAAVADVSATLKIPALAPVETALTGIKDTVPSTAKSDFDPALATLDTAVAPSAGAGMRADYVSQNPEPIAPKTVEPVTSISKDDPRSATSRINNVSNFYVGSGGAIQDFVHVIGDRLGIAGGVVAGVATVVGLGMGAVPVLAGVCAGVGVYAGARFVSDRGQKALWGKSYYQPV